MHLINKGLKKLGLKKVQENLSKRIKSLAYCKQYPFFTVNPADESKHLFPVRDFA